MASKDLFFVEFLPRVAAASATVSSTRPHLTFTGRDIHSAFGVHDCSNAICCWNEAEYRLHVTSCSDLMLVPNEGFRVRFRAKCDSKAFTNLLDTKEEDVISSNDCQLELKCGFCHTQISKKSHVFRRVLPLPSEAWRELSGDFFCHPPGATSHSSAGNTLSDPGAIKLLPRAGDCLVNESVLLLQSCSLDLDAVQFKRDSSGSVQKLHCARCLLCLGSTMEAVPDEVFEKDIQMEDSFSLSLQRARVRMGSQDTNTLSMERKLAKSLNSASETTMACKLLIKDPAGRKYLLVWMLNVMSKLVWNTSPTGPASALSRFTGDSGWSKECSSVAGACDSIVVKLLYRSLTLDDSSLEQSCEVLELTREECLYLMLALSDNNQAIPPSQRNGINGFKVSFLRLSAEKGAPPDPS